MPISDFILSREGVMRDFVSFWPNGETYCVRRKEGKEEKWERTNQLTIALFPFPNLSLFPALTPKFNS
jgi:hypothetical protein